MEKPTVEEVANHIAANLPPGWGKGFMPVYIDGNQVWLRSPGRERIIRIDVVDLPRDQWPSIKEP